MATIVNNPAPAAEGNNGMGFVIGVLLLIVFFYLLVVYGLPALRSSTSAPQINVPDKVDVNVNQK